MKSFSDWLKNRTQQESTARTRAVLAFTNGTGVWPGGNPNQHATASAATVAKFNALGRKTKKKRFGATVNKKKVTVTNKNTQVDSFLSQVDGLKGDLAKLRDVFDKKKAKLKKDSEEAEKKKPESDTDIKKDQDKKPKTDEPDKDKPDDDDDNDNDTSSDSDDKNAKNSKSKNKK